MGRLNLSGDWRAHYQARLCAPEEAAASVRSGDHIWIPPLHGSPAVLAALAARRDELRDVQIRALGVPDVGFYTREAAEAFHFQDQFGSLFTRGPLEEHVIDYHPYWLVGGHKALDAGREGEAWGLDHVMITVSEPNAQGSVCVGGNLWDSVPAARRAKHVIAEVNPNVVETYGETWLHVTEIDQFVPQDRPVAPPAMGEYDAVDELLAQQVGSLVHDGDTVQIGTGSHTGGMVHYGLFADKQELSYFGELTVPGLVPLVERGVFTGRTSALHPHRFVATLIGNTAAERATIHRNRAFELYPLDHMLDPRTIARNEGIVAVNGALSVDLTGQVAAYTIGSRIYAGMGGHLAFATGAFLAPRGRYICVLPSTAMGGTVSTITAEFVAGQAVSVPREVADTVVTEQGVARLLGKSLRQRAEELISVAHADFRAELRNAAKTFFYPTPARSEK